MGQAGDPIGAFAGIDYEGVFPAVDVLAMGVAVNYQIVLIGIDYFVDVMRGVDHVDFFAVQGAAVIGVENFSVEISDNFSNHLPFTFVIAENRDEFGGFQLGKSPDGKRRDKIAGMQYIIQIKFVEDVNSRQNMLLVVVGVGNDTDFHFSTFVKNQLNISPETLSSKQ